MNINKLCWWITNKCNEHCEYCFRSLSSNDFTFDDHMNILNNILSLGTKQITWSGGEVLLIPYIADLIKYAKKHGIYNKITTNGILLTKEKIIELAPYVDLVALPIDSLDDKTNEYLGRGAEHRKTVINRIKHIQKMGIKLDINTVVMKPNIGDLDEMGSFFKATPISGKWKLMTFFPVREKALANKDKFIIPDETFLAKVSELLKKYKDLNITYMMKYNNNTQELEQQEI